MKEPQHIAEIIKEITDKLKIKTSNKTNQTICLMPRNHKKKENPKLSTSENAAISKGWNDATKGRVPVYCQERKAVIYKKAA